MDICLAGNVVTQEEPRVRAQLLKLNIDESQVKSNALLKTDGSVYLYLAPFNTYTKYTYFYSYQHLLDPEDEAGPGLGTGYLQRQHLP